MSKKGNLQPFQAFPQKVADTFSLGHPLPTTATPGKFPKENPPGSYPSFSPTGPLHRRTSQSSSSPKPEILHIFSLRCHAP